MFWSTLFWWKVPSGLAYNCFPCNPTATYACVSICVCVPVSYHMVSLPPFIIFPLQSSRSWLYYAMYTLKKFDITLVCCNVFYTCFQNLAIATANRNNCSLIIANDPDADRLALAERQRDGTWKVFNGNETGALLAWWALTNYKQKNPSFDG